MHGANDALRLAGKTVIQARVNIRTDPTADRLCLDDIAWLNLSTNTILRNSLIRIIDLNSGTEQGRPTDAPDRRGWNMVQDEKMRQQQSMPTELRSAMKKRRRFQE
jgi:hypothetical protein